MLAYGFVLLALAVRILSGTGYLSLMGFTPLGASFIFFGAHMPRKRIWIPFALMIAADSYLTFVKYRQALTWDQGLIWCAYFVPWLLGGLLKDHIKPKYVAAAGLTNAVSFFVWVNFVVWLAGWVGYPKTIAGLMASYVAGIPFFERGLTSDLLFSAIFFSIPVLIAKTREALPAKAHKNTAI
jgi:hypothetical protein